MTRPDPSVPPPPAGFRGAFRDDADARAVYAEAAGIARVMPLAVAVPADGADVQRLVRWAAEQRVALVARGSGSSMGGAAIGPGVIVDLSRLRDVGRVDVARRCVSAGPGATQREVDGAAREAGLRFPVDPSSSEYCSVGGMAATNAAGAHSLQAGSMRPWVRALDCIFADGSRATVRRGEPWPSLPLLATLRKALDRARSHASEGTTRIHPADRLRKDSSGYALVEVLRSGDLVDLLVGSEGTLALFVGLELGLAPLPAATASLLAAFPSLDGATTAAGEARARGAAACELLDRTFLEVAAEGGQALPVPDGSEAVLLVECEAASDAEAGAQIRTLAAAFEAAGAGAISLALDPEQERTLWSLRHRASPILARLHPRLASMQFIEDGAVPPDQLPAYVRGVRGILDRHGVRGVMFGHAGDAHVHVNPLVDVSHPDWRRQVEGILAEVVELTASLGGTLAGEHGDGRLRTPLLPRLRGPAVMALYAAVKAAMDPAGILNPGVKVPLPGQRAIEGVKYDPALPPLPAAARRALDIVARERAYGRFRLDLLEEAPDVPPRRSGGRAAETSDVEGEAEPPPMPGAIGSEP